ncbi:MAG: serine/threonine protein kinase, partial [Chloroflexi bacterium]|nr:serine/threonine protein kinase [Chloroflexota bacterium]
MIGHGGMAIVYKAYQPELDRIVAIKIPLPAFVDDADFRSCFEREARLVARLRHPHIVGIYSVGDEEGVPYLVMEYLQGQTLHTVLRQRVHAGALYTPAEALALLTPIASALDYAHTSGVIHGDLKPENIILTANGPVITDFGLAKLVQEEAASASVVMGTPSYMSPEQIQAETIDRRSDVYALGILLYELLTGKVPFTGPTSSAVAQAHLSQPPPALATRQPRLAATPLLDEIVRRAVAKRKADRWPSAGAMVSALAHAVEASGIPALRAPMPARPVALPETARPVTPRRAGVARLQPPPPAAEKGGRLVLLLPIVVVLITGLWAVRAWADRNDKVAAG